MKTLIYTIVATTVVLASNAFAGQTYYADPAKGSPNGDGSAAKPWKTLEEVANNGKLKNLKGGDTLLLADGLHGDVTFAGENNAMVTIAPAKGARPKLNRLTITSGKNWTVQGLLVSPSFGGKPYKKSIITFGEGGDSSDIIIEDCYVTTAEDASNWGAKEWMDANDGILMGRHGKNLTLRNNYLKNTRFGLTLSAFDSTAEGNVITDFSGDAVRATRDGEVVQHNIIKNNYVSEADGDKNHDDGIQVFLHNAGKGTVKGIKTIGNIIIGHEDPKQKLHNDLQGIGYFDGPLIDFVVKDNVVAVDSYHAISLYDAQNAVVENNVVWAAPGQKNVSWIMFGTKIKEAKDNTAKNNWAPKYNLKQPGTVEEKNQKVTDAIFKEALKKRYKEITDKYGAKHFAAGDKEKLTIK
jgi:hypothetical protein